MARNPASPPTASSKPDSSSGLTSRQGWQIFLCAALWGSAFPLIKFIYGYWGSAPLDRCLLFAGVRFALAGLLVLLIPGPKLRWKGANWKLLIALALSQTFCQYFCFYSGLAVSSGILGALLTGCGSFWWMLLAPWFLKTPKPTTTHWLLLLVCSTGIAIAVYAPGAGSGDPWLGALCFLGSSLSGAVGLIILKPLSKTVDLRQATGFALFSGGLLLTLTGVTAAPEFLSGLDPVVGLTTLYLALVSAVSFTLWNRFTETIPVNTLAQYRFLIPLSGIIQSSLFIRGESPGFGIFVGGFLITAALVVLQRLPSGKR